MRALMSASIFVLFALAACGSKAKSEPAQPTQPAAADEHGKLALCTDKGAVPLDATSCRLDLGTGVDSHWSDSDGIDPGTAGCHYEYADSSCSTLKPGRTFGEFCLDDDRLVESNPGAGECHTHGGDLGHPDVVSCEAWCQAEQQLAGRCEGGVAAEGDGGACESAHCVCGG